MRTGTPYFRLTAALSAMTLLLSSAAMPSAARAQQLPDRAQPEQIQTDPPGRVGRLARTSGTVSYHAAGDTEWTQATTNFPVAPGSAFWTQPGAQAELQFSASRIALAGGSEIDIGALDNAGLRATLTQGTALLRPRDLAPGETWTLQTPRGTVTADRPARIVVAAGDTGAPTVVAVLEGEARIAGPGLDQPIAAGQAATVTGTDTLQANIGPAGADAFAQNDLARDRPPLPPPARLQAAPPPPSVAAMPGGEDLAAYGVWSAAPDYGEVWYPQVDPGWAPYRDGHWAFIAPWGWTWVDDAPWGFAPFHYGRWLQLGGRWGWTPAYSHERRSEYPVYAPALVTFVGIGAGIAIGAALASGSIGWIPLGPREPYRPWYHASPRYLGAVNRGPMNAIGGATGFRNHAAATMVPASAMMSSHSVRPIAQPIGPQTLSAARPLVGQQPVRPTLSTAGVTPGVARQMNLAQPGVPRPSAPGPAFTPRAAAPVPGLRPPSVQTPIQAPHPPAAFPQVQRPSAPGFVPGAAAPHFAAPVAPRPAQPFAAPVPHAPPAVQRPTQQFVPPPQVRQAAPPAPHFQAPAPQIRSAPPPPAAHAAPAQQKRPGER